MNESHLDPPEEMPLTWRVDFHLPWNTQLSMHGLRLHIGFTSWYTLSSGQVSNLSHERKAEGER